MTSTQRWSTSLNAEWVARLALVVQVSGGTLTRTMQRHPANQQQIQIRGNNRVDTIFGAGLDALLFFSSIPLFRIRNHAMRRCDESHRAEF